MSNAKLVACWSFGWYPSKIQLSQNLFKQWTLSWVPERLQFRRGNEVVTLVHRMAVSIIHTTFSAISNYLRVTRSETNFGFTNCVKKNGHKNTTHVACLAGLKTLIIHRLAICTILVHKENCLSMLCVHMYYLVYICLLTLL
jgi:hypothetical protein